MEFINQQVKLLVDGAEYTQPIYGIKYVDAAALQPDFLTLELGQVLNANRIELHLKGEQGFFECGFFYPTRTSKDFKNKKVEVFCTSIKNKNLRVKRLNSFQSISLSQIVQKIAEQNGLQAVCKADVQINFVAQTNETDVAFLERLAGLYGLQIGIKKNQLCLIEHAKAPQHSFEVSQLLSYEANTINSFNSCVVHWRDVDANREHTIKLGGPTPTQNIFIGMGNQEQATRLGQKFLLEQQQNSLQGNFGMSGQELFAGNAFIINNADLDGQLLLAKKVEHNVGPQGWVMRVQFCKCASI